jgi:signal transduction histidine kinase
MARRLLLFLFLFLGLSAIGQKALIIQDGFSKQVLSDEIFYFIDESNSLTLNEVIGKKFLQNDVPRPNFGFVNGALWIKVTVDNTSNFKRFICQLNQPFIDSLAFYQVDETGQLVKTSILGEAFPLENREIIDRYLMVPFDLGEQEQSEIYLKINSVEPLEIPLYITTIAGSYEMMRISDLLFAAYYGLILVMIFYNLFVYFSVRDRSYLQYVFYILMVGLTQAALEGYTYLYLWPSNFWISSRSIYVLTCLTSITSILFLRGFLQTRIYTPKMHRVSLFLILALILLMIAALVDVNKAVHQTAQVAIGIVAIFILISSILVFKKGYTPAKYFLIAWIILIVGIMVFSLQNAGIIPSNPVTIYMLQFGSAVETIILSLALADRINILKREKALSQAQALEASIENERIVREQNIILEDKVKVRTSDLENSNNQLTSTLTDLKNTQSKLVSAEKMASLGQLTAGVAHEINNPINFVSANITPLKYDVEDLIKVIELYDEIQGKDDFESKKKEIETLKAEIDLEFVKAEIQQLLEGIQDGASRTAEIVKGLKNFSRLDESNLKPIDINEGIESTLILVKSEIPEGTQVIKRLGEIQMVECLGGKINQVFMNIITNALQSIAKVDPNAKRELVIETWQDNDFVYSKFTDSGLGMKPEVIEHIFEPFYTTKDVGEGTGLGLSISFNIISTHNGEILVESTFGEGAAFTIKLPREANIQEL